MIIISRPTDEMEAKVAEMKCDISREGRLLSVFRDDSTLAVYRLQSTPDNIVEQPILEIDNVKSSVWHHEESRVLLTKRNGDVEWRTFQRNLTFTVGRLSAEQLLKHLIAKKLEFDSLKNIRCLAFQRDFCILQTSTRQIAALQWKSNLTSKIVWGLKVDEFAAWTFCDKLFIVFDPHTKKLHLYSMFTGKVKKTVQLEFSDNGAPSPVRRIAACPNGRTFALLTDQLFIGGKKLHLLLPDGRTVTHFSLGTERIAVFTKQPDEYLLYDYSTLQKVCSYSLRPGELMMVSGQQYDRADKVMSEPNVLRDLMELNQTDLMVHIDVRPSLLSTALASRHLESSANVLKIAERCDETETCRILQVLNQFIQSDEKGSPFVLQILGLALGFAGRAFKTFPDCPTIFNLMYEWQELLTVRNAEPLVVKLDLTKAKFYDVWKDMEDEYHVVEDALLHNCLLLAQQFMMDHSPHQFRNVKYIRQMVLTRLQEVTRPDDPESMDHAAILISKLGYDADETWLDLCCKADRPEAREKLADILRRRNFVSAELADALEFIAYAEKHVTSRDTLSHAPSLTLQLILGWSQQQRRLFLAEAFLNTRNEELLTRIRPEDVWQVMLNKQILSSLRQWIENQCGCIRSDSSVPYVWPVSEEMVEDASGVRNVETREAVLNMLALHGVFAGCERKDLSAFIRRLNAINKFREMEEILAKPHSNVTLSDIRTAVLDYCDVHFQPGLFYDVIQQLDVDLVDRPLWMSWIAEYQTWIRNPDDIEGFLHLCRLNNRLLCGGSQPEEQFWIQNPFVTLFFHLMGHYPPSTDTTMKALSSLPFFNTSGHPAADQPAASLISQVHQLLDGEIPIKIQQFFRWRSSSGFRPEEEMPHFTDEVLSAKYGQVVDIDWTFYLRLGRPLRAWMAIRADAAPAEEDATCLHPFAIQAIALDDPWDLSVCLSSVFLTEMLGFDTHPLRITLAVLDRIAASQLPEAADKTRLKELSRNVMADQQAAAELGNLLESTLLEGPAGSEGGEGDASIASTLEDWALAVEFCTLYGLALPVRMLQQCARRNQWQLFVLFIQRFDYPIQLLLPILKEFANPCMKDHLELALQLDYVAAQNYLSGSPEATEAGSIAAVPASDFYSLLLQASGDADIRSNLLDFACRKRSVEMTVMAAVLDPTGSFRCLCAYVCLSLPEAPQALPEWNSETLTQLLQTAMSIRQPDLVVEAFRIFLPDHLLTRLLNWLDAFCRGEADKTTLEELRAAVLDYEEEPEFFRDVTDVVRIALLLLSWWLTHTIQDVEKQMELVAMWADVLPFQPLLTDSGFRKGLESRKLPDFGLIFSILSLIAESGIELELPKLLGDRNSFRSECQCGVELLVSRKQFDLALQLASLADLPSDSVFVTRMKAEFEDSCLPADADADMAQLLNIRTTFWSKCHQLFTQHHVLPEIACHFYQESLDKSLSHWESHVIASYALRWMQLIHPVPHDSLAELEMIQWKYRIQAELTEAPPPQLEPANPAGSTSGGCPLLSGRIRNLTVDRLPPAADGLSPAFVGGVTSWIERALDAEDILLATKLSKMFGLKNRDLLLIELLLHVVESVLPLDELQQRLKELTPDGSDDDVECKDRQWLMDAVDARLQHGQRLLQRICVYHSVATSLDLKYDYVVDHQRPLSVLKMLLATRSSQQPASAGANLNLARSWISVAGVASGDVVQLVKEELIGAARAALDDVDAAAETTLVTSLLRGQFNRLVTGLCSDVTAALGSALLEAALAAWRCQELPVAIELLIFAHSSFTLACHVESIGAILNEARRLVDALCTDGHWMLITRLLTGIQRYSEMDYVFDLLKDKDHFEFLLRKGMDRLPLLRTALLDYLRRNCAQDTELFRMVALHFHMHSEVAAMWRQEALGVLQAVVDSASAASVKPPASPIRRTSSSSASSGDGFEGVAYIRMLKATPELKERLTSAMHSMAHSAEYYLQAGKLNEAGKCSLQSELVALQIFLVNSATAASAASSSSASLASLASLTANSKVYCVLGINIQTANYLILHTNLSFPEADILSRAYDVYVNWGQALSHHYITGNDSSYLEAVARSCGISVRIVEDAVDASVDAPTRAGEQLARLSHLISMLDDVEAKYRIASRLGLRQLVGELLVSPALPYLKDTAWKTSTSTTK